MMFYDTVVLAHISHQASTAAADTGMSTALRSVGLLDVVSTTPPGPSGRAPCIHARLHRLATNLGEKCGLVRPGGLDPPPKKQKNLVGLTNQGDRM